MPNWCQNIANITHEDLEKLDAIVEELKKDDPELFNSLVPNPAGEWQYDWCVANWGTKWDISPVNEAERIDENTMTGFFDTAWGPAIQAYEAMEELGFTIDAMYHEPGMGFAGMYEDGYDEYLDLSGYDSEGLADMLPERLDEAFCISEQAAQWEEENQEAEDE